MPVVIQVENLSKYYRLGLIGGGTLREDLNRWWAKARGRPDPLLKIGDTDHGNREGGELWALRDVSFQVREGEILGIIGRNGAGKSTLLKILSRITAPTSGQVKIKGRVGSLLEVGTGFHPELTGRENIYLNGAILGMKKAEIDRKLDEIIDFAEIEQFIDTPVKRYSSGMYVRLAFAVAAHLEPEILIVDEVLAVGDTVFQKKCLKKMEHISKGGRTILYVSHNLHSISSLCSRVVLISNGTVVLSGNPAKVISRYTSHNSFHHDKKRSFPIKSKCGTISMSSLSSIHKNGGVDINFVITTTVHIGRLGVGFSVGTEDGVMLCNYGAVHTGNVIHDVTDTCIFRLRLLNFDKVLNGGRYIIGVWLSIPNYEKLLEIDDACSVDIEERDTFGMGRHINNKTNGPLILESNVTRESNE